MRSFTLLHLKLPICEMRKQKFPLSRAPGRAAWAGEARAPALAQGAGEAGRCFHRHSAPSHSGGAGWLVSRAPSSSPSFLQTLNSRVRSTHKGSSHFKAHRIPPGPSGAGSSFQRPAWGDLRGAGACPRSTGVPITPGGPCRASTPPLRMRWAPHNPRPPSDHTACGARAGHTPGLPAGPSSLPLPHRQRLPGLKRLGPCGVCAQAGDRHLCSAPRPHPCVSASPRVNWGLHKLETSTCSDQ